MPAHRYMVDEAQFPYCSGCGHTWINKSLDAALSKLNYDPRQINLVTDIGCVGLVDKLFLTNTIHTLHGRSTAVATGLKVADTVLFNADTKHIVMIGDGGSTIGLLHLVEAARLNIDITVLLHNNFVYGMTGGQNSGFTPIGFKTASTMSGNLVAPIHIAEMLRATGATYIARKLATDADLDEAILAAIKHPGFALVEVIELCTGYASKWNKLAKSDVQTILENSNSAQLGIIHEDKERPSFSVSYKQEFPTQTLEKKSKTAAEINRKLEDLEILMLGSAGEGVQFAARSLMQLAMATGMHAIQKNDNPITIGTGYSMSELKLSRRELLYSGIDKADYVLISSVDGFSRIRSELKELINPEGSTIICDSSLEDALKKLDLNNATIISADFRKLCKSKKDVNFMLMGRMLLELKSQGLSDIEPADFIKILSKNTEAIIVAIEQGFKL